MIVNTHNNLELESLLRLITWIHVHTLIIDNTQLIKKYLDVK